MGREQTQAHRLPRRLFQQVADQQHVAQGLGHFFASNVHQTIVNPVTAKLRDSVRTGALGGLVLVVGKDQVQSAAVNVDGLVQVRPHHGGALSVPTRAAVTPGAVPADTVRRRRLPEHEVRRIALVRLYLDPGAGDEILLGASRECTVGVEAGHREQHVILGDVGVAGLEQPLDQGDDFRQMFGGPGLDVRRQHAERTHILMKGSQVPRCQHADRHALLPGRLVDLVVHVGDIADVDQPVGAAQQPRQHVEYHAWPGVADVGETVDRGPADVHGHPLRIPRLEAFASAREGIV